MIVLAEINRSDEVFKTLFPELYLKIFKNQFIPDHDLVYSDEYFRLMQKLLPRYFKFIREGKSTIYYQLTHLNFIQTIDHWKICYVFNSISKRSMVTDVFQGMRKVIVPESWHIEPSSEIEFFNAAEDIITKIDKDWII